MEEAGEFRNPPGSEGDAVILVVGLSPAWQRTLEYDRFVIGKVNRSIRVSETASGKGVNVARVAQQLGADVRLLTVAGGVAGDRLSESIRSKGLDARIVRVRTETRICQTILAKNIETTELVEETKPLARREVAEVLACFAKEIRRARILALSGTVPPGCGDDFYARLVREANRRGIPVLIDAQRKQLLKAVNEQLFLVKINRDELGMALDMDCSRASDLRSAASRLMTLGAQRLVLTQGREAVYAFDSRKANPTILDPPHVKAANPIGSGDAMLAGIAFGLSRGENFLDALRLGIACGSANAMTTDRCVRNRDVKRLMELL